MLIDELREYYGTWADMTRKLELGNTTYLGWRRKGYIPWTTQLVIEKKTNKKFKADMEHAKPKK